MAEGNYTHLNGLLSGAFLKIPFTVSTSTTSGQIASQQNPEGPNGAVAPGTAPVGNGSGEGLNLSYDTPGEVIVDRAILIIRTPPTVDVVLDVGVGSTATTDAKNLIDGLTIKAGTAANTLYSNLSAPGSSGKAEVYMSPFAYCNVTVASGNANGLSAEVFVRGIQTTGGP